MAAENKMLCFGYEPGDYERQGDGGYEGMCAACREYVAPNEPSVILHSETGERGGIFHASCAPTGPQWYGVGEGDQE